MLLTLLLWPFKYSVIIKLFAQLTLSSSSSTKLSIHFAVSWQSLQEVPLISEPASDQTLNSPIYDKCKSQPAKISWDWTQDDLSFN